MMNAIAHVAVGLLLRTFDLVAIGACGYGSLALVCSLWVLFYRPVLIHFAHSSGFETDFFGLVAFLAVGGSMLAAAGIAGVHLEVGLDWLGDEPQYLARARAAVQSVGLWLGVIWMACLCTQLLVHLSGLEEQALGVVACSPASPTAKWLAAYLVTLAFVMLPMLAQGGRNHVFPMFLSIIAFSLLPIGMRAARAMKEHTRQTGKRRVMWGWSAMVTSIMFIQFNLRHLDAAGRGALTAHDEPMVAQLQMLGLLAIFNALPTLWAGAVMTFQETEDEEEQEAAQKEEAGGTSSGTALADAPSGDKVIPAVALYLILGTALMACTAALDTTLSVGAVAWSLGEGFACMLLLLAMSLPLVTFHESGVYGTPVLVSIMALALMAVFTLLYKFISPSSSWLAALLQATSVLSVFAFALLAVHWLVCSFLSTLLFRRLWAKLPPKLGAPQGVAAESAWISELARAGAGGVPVLVQGDRAQMLHLSLPLQAPGYMSMAKNPQLMLHWLTALIGLPNYRTTGMPFWNPYNPLVSTFGGDPPGVDRELADAILRLAFPGMVLQAWQILIVYVSFSSEALWDESLSHHDLPDELIKMDLRSGRLWQLFQSWIGGWSWYYLVVTIGNFAMVFGVMLAWSLTEVRGRKLWCTVDIVMTGAAILVKLQGLLKSTELIQLGALSLHWKLSWTAVICLQNAAPLILFKTNYYQRAATSVLKQAILSGCAPAAANLLTVAAADLRGSMELDTRLLDSGFVKFFGTMLSKVLSIAGSHATPMSQLVFWGQLVVAIATPVSGHMVRMLRLCAVAEELEEQSRGGAAVAVLAPAPYLAPQPDGPPPSDRPGAGEPLLGAREEQDGISLHVVQERARCGPNNARLVFAQRYHAEVEVPKDTWAAWTLSVAVKDGDEVLERYHVAGETMGSLGPSQAVLDLTNFCREENTAPSWQFSQRTYLPGPGKLLSGSGSVPCHQAKRSDGGLAAGDLVTVQARVPSGERFRVVQLVLTVHARTRECKPSSVGGLSQQLLQEGADPKETIKKLLSPRELYSQLERIGA